MRHLFENSAGAQLTPADDDEAHSSCQKLVSEVDAHQVHILAKHHAGQGEVHSIEKKGMSREHHADDVEAQYPGHEADVAGGQSDIILLHELD